MGLTTITWLVFGFSWSFDEWGAGKGFTYVGFRHLDKVWPDTTMPGLGVLGKRQIMIPHHPPPPPRPFWGTPSPRGLTFAVFQMTFATRLDTGIRRHQARSGIQVDREDLFQILLF